MRELKKIRMQDVIAMQDREMKMVRGGSGTTGICGAFIPASSESPSISGAFGNHPPGEITAEKDLSFSANLGGYVWRGVNKDTALAMTNGLPGARWCCDSCSSASWYTYWD